MRNAFQSLLACLYKKEKEWIIKKERFDNAFSILNNWILNRDNRRFAHLKKIQ